MMLIDYRLKKVQGKKKRDADAAEARRKVESATQSLEPGPEIAPMPALVEESAPVDLLSSKDNDVIF